MVPCSMFCETESEFQIAAHTRAAASEASLIAPAPRILIVTPRLEFPANTTKQTLPTISNRFKIALFLRVDSPWRMPFLHLDTAFSLSFQPLVSTLQNLIANARLRSELSGKIPTVCKFLIANGSGFPIPQRSANPTRYEFHLIISKLLISNLPTARRIRDTSADNASLRAFLRCYASCGSRRKSE